jgi:preprotein translocase subunit SecF
LFKNNVEDEVDFCEAYKSQILNNDIEEKESPVVSILIILFLLALIIALSIFGYNYIMDNKSTNTIVSTSVNALSDDELRVTKDVETPIQSKKEFNTEESKKVIVKSFNELPKSKSVDIEDLADKIKIDLSKNEEINDSTTKESKKIEEPLAPVTDSVKSTYVEDLAKLTAEIDKERE